MKKTQAINVMLGGQKPNNLNLDNIWIGVDSGANFLFEKGVQPEFILGDLDSVNKNYLQSCQVIKKDNQDLTDTEFAIDWLVANFSELKTINLYGASGLRQDHFFANILLLSKALYREKNIRIIDDNNIIFLANKGENILKNINDYKYISFVPLKEDTYVSIEGAKYSVQNMLLSMDRANATSNEFDVEFIKFTTNKRTLVIYSKD